MAQLDKRLEASVGELQRQLHASFAPEREEILPEAEADLSTPAAGGAEETVEALDQSLQAELRALSDADGLKVLSWLPLIAGLTSVVAGIAMNMCVNPCKQMVLLWATCMLSSPCGLRILGGRTQRSRTCARRRSATPAAPCSSLSSAQIAATAPGPEHSSAAKHIAEHLSVLHMLYPHSSTLCAQAAAHCLLEAGHCPVRKRRDVKRMLCPRCSSGNRQSGNAAAGAGPRRRLQEAYDSFGQMRMREGVASLQV